MNFQELEREYDPTMGDLGRGRLVSQEEFYSLNEIPGYEIFAARSGGSPFLQLYGASGAPAAGWWRGFVREKDGKHYVVAFETHYAEL